MLSNFFIAKNIDQKEQKKLILFGLAAALIMSLIFQSTAYAATTGVEFKGLYDFIYGAGTGYLGRAICIFGGVVGLCMASATGKAIPAIIGVILAVFGTLGPTIVNSLFKSAVIF